MRLPRVGDIVTISFKAGNGDSNGYHSEFKYTGTIVQSPSKSLISLVGQGYCDTELMPTRDSYDFGTRRFLDDYREYKIIYYTDTLASSLEDLVYL